MYDTVVHKWLRVPYTLHVRHHRRAKKPRATVLFIHGIGNSGAAWDPVIKQLPADMRIISIDLLGFGRSPKPDWAIYSATTQARSVLATLFKLGLPGPIIIVGHSLGSLVAVEVAKRYPLLVSRLILCAPPFYRPDENTRRLPRHSDAVLRRIYTQAMNYPDQFVALAAFATKYQLVNKSFSVTRDNVHSYFATLRAAILNQTALDDAKSLKLPITVIQGTLDPVVINKNIKDLQAGRSNVTVKYVMAAHEVTGLFVGSVVKAIERAVK